MKKLFLSLSLLLCSIGVFAQHRSEQQAIEIAQEFFTPRPAALPARLAAVPQTQVKVKLDQHMARAKKAPAKNSACYIINDEANGRFVIVSADERMYQILGYSDNGIFSIENIPCGLLELFDEYNRQYDLIGAIGGTAKAAMKTIENITPITPLLLTKWGQGDKYCDTYWSQCPQYNGENCLSGCVATAMAQVMAYYKYPDSGMGGSVSYTTSKGIYQYMNFDSQHFDWSKMCDTYDYYFDDNGEAHWAPERTEEEINEVAKLMHACGVSVFMEYTPSNSGAAPYDIPYALIHYFGYNPNLYYAEKDFYKRDTWDSLIVSELAAKRPILYGGRGSLGGHRFVLDGVDSKGRYHFNFGWNGSDDGYYELDALNPDEFNFSSRQSMVLLITKETIGEPIDVFYSNNFTLAGTVSVNNSISAKFNPICYSNKANSEKVKFEGVYGIGVFDKDWNFIKSLYSSTRNCFAGSDFWFDVNVDVKFDASTFTEGSQYYIALYAKGNDKSTPTRMRTSMGANDWYRSTTIGGIVTLEPLEIIPDDPNPNPNPVPKPLPLTGNLKVLALDKAGDYKIWDVAVIKDGTDSKKYWFKGFDQIVTERGYTADNNQNTVYGIYEDDGSFTIPVPQQMGENLFLNNFSSDDGLSVVIAQDGGTMKINDTWGSVERKKSGDNTSQENVSVYTSATYYPKPPLPVETPVIVVSENHKMTIDCGTEGATIYYTLNGNTPATTPSQKYSEPVDIDRNLTIKAIAVTFDNANTSDVAQLSVNDFIVSLPTFSESNGEVAIKCPDADIIYYTTDESTPTIENGKLVNGEIYTKPRKFNATTTIKAIGVHDGWKNSDVASYEYIVIPDTVDIEVLNNIKGQLASRIPADKILIAKSLTVTGELNGTDITIIREMLVDGNLEYLNIKGCTIKAGGDKYPYLSLNYETEDNVIGRCMFARAKNLKAIVLPDNIFKVEYSAFSDCELLKEVTIPEGCIELNQAFTFCKNLEIVNLPNSLVKFASDNFAYCPKLIAINVSENNQSFISIDGALYSKDGKTLLRFANNKCREYNVIEGTEIIGAYAFYCSKVENVFIPTSVMSIENGAFYASENLKDVVLPNSVVNLGKNAFNGCSNLTSVVLSNQITSIESDCFIFCSSLKSIYFTKKIKEINPTAFNYCSLLQKFDVDASNLYLCSDDGVIFTKDKKNLVRCPIALYSEDFKLQEGVKNISDNAFMGCTNIVKFTLPLSVDSIGKHAFEGCSMSNIQLSDNVKFVGYQAFADCDSLKTFVLPNSLKEIAQSMFIFDYALSYVKIHGDVTKIGSSAFRFCRELTTIECTIKDIENVEVGDLAFDGIPDDCTWYIPMGTEEKYKACSWWVPTWQIVPLHENLLVATNIIVEAGKSAVLPIELNNDDVIRMIQFELRLPEGVSMLYDGEKEDYAIELTERSSKQHSLQCAKLPNGNYQFVLSTMTLDNLIGSNGTLVFITLKADENAFLGVQEAYLSNVELTSVDNDGSLNVIRPNDSPFRVSVFIGDVNKDGAVDVADISSIITVMADGGNNANADVNGDGAVDVADISSVISIMAASAREMKVINE